MVCYEKLLDNIIKDLGIKYNFIYIAVDIHGTILVPTRNKKENFEYLPNAKECLQYLSKLNFIKLIIYSSSYNEKIKEYLDRFEIDGIKFDYSMDNPEILSNNYADFSKKFYFDLLLDDKCGFECSDWKNIYNFLSEKFG